MVIDRHVASLVRLYLVWYYGMDVCIVAAVLISIVVVLRRWWAHSKIHL